MRNSTWSVVSAIFMAVGFWNPASAETCQNPDQDTITLLKKLYGYAQLAEAPKENNFYYMENCKDQNGTMIVGSPTHIMELTVPGKFTDLVIMRADNGRAILQPTPRNGNGEISPFTVGCSMESNDQSSILIDYSFRLFAKIIGNRIFFYLTGTEVKGTVIARDSGEPITIIGGTNPIKLPEIKANSKGEECVFPLVKTTVSVLCEVLRSREGDVYEAFVENNRDEYFSHRPKSLTMIGHSLGGSATQYVAMNIPSNCTPEQNSFDFQAYAFASPGLMEQGSAENQPNLESYLINGDWLLGHNVFSDRSQHGHVSVYTPPKWKMIGPKHSINDVQKSICMCLQGEGLLGFPSGNLQNKHIFQML